MQSLPGSTNHRSLPAEVLAARQPREADPLLRIQAPASTLEERKAAADARAKTPDSESPDRLQRWCDSVALGRWELLDRRLRWDGLDRRAAHGLVNDPPPATEPEPWTLTLRAVLDRAGIDEPSADEAGIAFSGVLAPFAEHAVSRLERRLPERRETLTDDAVQAAVLALKRLLSQLASPVLWQEFQRFRAGRETRLDRLFGEVTAGDLYYPRFAERCAEGGLAEIMRRFPVLARQLATATDDWIDTISELARRLAADARDLDRAYGGGTPLGPAVALRLGLSDRHHHGRSVAVITFAGGRKVVYKPKCLRVDAAFFRLLDWINRRRELPPFRTLEVLPRDGYGWMEHARPEPCADLEEVDRFYRRTGRLLCLVYALEGCDCHAENVIAAGEQPVLIDLETLMSPSAAGRLDDSGLSPATATAVTELHRSVLRTGLLPSWTLGADGRRVDVSMLGATPGQKRLAAVTVWRDPGTDRMRREERETTMPPRHNLPTLAAGEAVESDGRDRQVVAGFREMYRFLLRHRDALLRLPRLIPSWERLRVRYVLRQTRLYGTTLRRLTEPRFLRDGAEWSFGAESLCRLWIFLGERPAHWPLYAREAEALMRLDVPYFAADGSSRDVLDHRGRVVAAGRFEATPHQRLRQRIDGLSPEDMEHQVGYIRAAFLARATGSETAEAPRCREMPRVAWDDVPAIDDRRCLELAEEIGEQLARSAIPGPRGTCTWIALDPLRTDSACNLRPIGLNLHSGSAGVAIFLAALGRATGEPRWRELARGALKEVTQAVSSSPDRLAEAIGLGANLGLGSILYGLTVTAELLGDDAPLRPALAAAAAIRPSVIERDEKHDVVFGTAGAVLTLLRLHRASGDEQALEAAHRCGRHLLDRLRPTPEGPRSCPTMDGGFHTGFSHGAAGLVSAFTALATATGESAFERAASDVQVWEESLFDAEQGNYPDLRRQGEGSFLTAWCHGAPGIGLARLTRHLLTGCDESLAQAERCLHTTYRQAAGEADHLCCGNAGRLDVLLAGGRRLRRPDLTERARRLATWIDRRAEGQGGYRLPAGLTATAFSPGLFTGLAGIGYTWLRLARPELPSILHFE